MAAFLERFGIFARSPDPRPLAEIAADIDDELAFHVEQSTRALAAEGLDSDTARAEALRRFGDYGRIRRECARTQMGERIMLQRIQLVLTAVLVVAVGLMLWSSRESSATLAAERAASTALMARLETQIARVSGAPANVPGASDDALERAGSVAPIASDDQVDSQPTDLGAGYVTPDGKEAGLEWASEFWKQAFQQQRTNWRHGLKLAERLSSLPGSQGAEILTEIWSSLSVEHREQVMKPFVLDGGHPNALEVIALGTADPVMTVRQRAVLYLETYAWKNLLFGDGAVEAWLSEWREIPVAEVLRANATRWSRELGDLLAQYEQILPGQQADQLLSVVGHIRLDTFAKEGVDLGAILREHGVDKMTDVSLGLLPAEQRANGRLARSWCTPK